MAAELRLNVSLDLGFFRQQLQKLTVVAQSEFAPKLNVKFNRSTLDRELNNLQNAIKRRVYRIEIGGNIDAFPDKITSIRRELAALETQKEIKIPITVENGVTKKDSSAVVASIRRSIREDALEDTGNKIRIPVSITPSITQKDIADFKKAVKASLDGISVDVKANVKGGGFAGSPVGAAGLMEFMRTQGMVGKTASGMEMRMRNEPGAGKIQRTALDQLARAILFMAGIDPAQIRQAQAERRRIPNIDFNPTVPPRSFSIGPSSTGRALPPGAIAKGLPGTAFGAQKYLPTALGEELKQVLRGAANAFMDAVKQNIRAVKITDLGAPVSRQGLLGGRTPAGFLPAGVGRVPGAYSTGRLGREGETREQLFARREREARMRSALRGVDIMGAGPSRVPAPYSQSYRAARPTSAIIPYAAPGALVAQGGGTPPSRGTGGPFGGRPGGPGGMQFNMPNLPGAGIVREFGQEFGFAAKQVLLFGTAYKALAFIQTFPAQVGEAVGALQSFRNTIGEISPTAEEAGASSQFILDIVEKYNVPLQSARDGFVKLYASMQPAGFSGDEIRDLFLGISQTAATFGMSADKVDRVNYAFAQMASKGQVMSEELKGQLGDVLPGAMAIFAEAAGFKGPEAISKFSEALEDGAYKGGAMKTLLTNVGVIMRKEFGPGAEGAARTFQGVMNRMQNSTKLLYESFEPVAVGFLNSVVMPMTNGIKTITDGFNAFFTGTAAKTSGGFAFAQELEKLRPSFEGIAQNVKELLPLLQTFGSVLLNVGKFFAVIAGNPITGFLLKLYGNILLVNTVFNLLGGRILVNLITNLGASISRFIALNIAMASMQRTSAVTNSTLAGTQLQMALLTRNASAAIGPVSLLKNALIGLARIGLIAIAINVVINGMAEIDRLKKSLADIGTFSSAGYRKEISAMSKEDVNSRLITNRATQKQIKEELKQYQGMGGNARGLVTGRDEELRGRLVTVQSKEQELIRANRSAKTQVQLSSSVTGAGLAPIPLTGGDGKPSGGKGGGKGEKAAENLREEIERQAQAASNALFSEKQRLLVLQQTNPIAKAFVEYTNQEANITRQLNVDLKEAKGDAEKKDLIAKAGIERKINERNLEEEINQARKNSLEPIENILKDQREKLQYEEEYKELLSKKINPEVAKQMLEVRQIVRAQLEALDLSIKNASAAITEAEARGASAEAVKKLRDELAGLEKDRADAAGKGEAAEGGVPQGAEKTDGQKITDRIGALKQEIQELTSLSNIAIQSADGIGTAFGEAFAGLISGSVTAQEALGNFFKSVGDMFIQMATEIIAKQMTMIILQTILKALGAVAGGGGGGGASTGFGSGFDQLGGANFGTGGNVTGFFGANGGVAAGGWQPFPVTAFANGGMVTGPTLGLVGEGKYNEAIVPLPNGRSIPVQLQGDESIRNKMDRDRYNNGGGASVLNMSFETTEIGGVEYVSRDQLEQAMAETRRNATRDGAQRGMSMTLDRIQNSSSTRRRIGV